MPENNHLIYSLNTISKISHSTHWEKNVTEENFRDIELLFLYSNVKTITKQKFNDLMVLMDYVPQKYQSVYQKLRTNYSFKDYDFVSDDSDDE